MVFSSAAAAPSTTPSGTVLRALPTFNRVWLDIDGRQQTCSLKTAIFELKRQCKTLADITLVDLDTPGAGPRSRQCQAIYDALLDSGLPDPAFIASKAPLLV